MSLFGWEPFDAVLERAFGTAGRGFVPPVEMTVAEDGDLLITMEIPGVDIADVDVEVQDGRLTISGERRAEQPGRPLLRELRHGAFRRSFQLPDTVRAEHIDAAADKGLLLLRVRGAATPAAPAQKVTISRAAPALPGHT